MNSNKPAYPIYTDDMPVEGGPGLTKREKIAAQNFASLIGLIPFNELELSDSGKDYNEGFIKAIAKISIVGADTLLKEMEATDG